MFKRLVMAAAVSGVALGLAVGTMGQMPTEVVVAQACGLHTACGGGDLTRTASLLVGHTTTGSVPVVPNTGETWSIAARYTLQTDGTACDCADRTASATIDVDRSGSGWTVSCTSGCGAGTPFNNVSVCDGSTATCHTSSGPNVYQLMLDMVANYNFTNTCNNVDQIGKLTDVTFTTTSVDNGNPIVIGPPCSTGNSVSPTSQTWTATDSGAFECAFSCASVSGPSVTITYQ